MGIRVKSNLFLARVAKSVTSSLHNILNSISEFIGVTLKNPIHGEQVVRSIQKLQQISNTEGTPMQVTWYSSDNTIKKEEIGEPFFIFVEN